MRRRLQHLFADVDGQDLVEYAIIVGMVALGVVLILQRPWQDDPMQGPPLGHQFDQVTTQLGS